MEIYDLVDEKDNVIGKTNKEESHKKGLPHRVVAVYVFTDDGKLLVQHRKKDGLLDHSVGGHVHAGETYDVAALRELKEELGLIRNNLERVGSLYSDERGYGMGLKIVHCFSIYEAKLKNADKIIESKDEVERIIPMTLSELAKLMTSNPEKFTLGFINTFNFYIRERKIELN